MKVRIGYGLGTRSLTNDAGRFNAFVDALEGCVVRLALALRTHHRASAPT